MKKTIVAAWDFTDRSLSVLEKLEYVKPDGHFGILAMILNPWANHKYNEK